MAIGMSRKKRTLDGKLCFDLWIETGSVAKVCNILLERGIVNPISGKKVTPMGVWGSAWTYILENLVEARRGVESVWKANGELLTDKDWFTLVVGKARYIYGKKKFEKFMKQHSYLTPYLN